jgi:hypothetical protein
VIDFEIFKRKSGVRKLKERRDVAKISVTGL